MAVHPLRPATYHCLGEPLPHQLTNRTQSSLVAHIAFIHLPCEICIISGISIRFQMLSRSTRQVLYALLTRPPSLSEDSDRLACVKHSVSVHPEPGSNSSFNLFCSVINYYCFCFTPIYCCVCFFIFLYSVANVLLFAAFSRTRYILPQVLFFVNCFFIFFIFLFLIL